MNIKYFSSKRHTKHIKIKRITQIKDIEIDCLAFAYDLAILTRDIPTAQKQIEILKEIVEKVGLHITFGKTEYITSYKPAPKFLETKNVKIKRISQFKYLGEISRN